MAGLNLAGGGGARRALDAEVNSVPMIDLMFVTIAFLLITAVWSEMKRLEATSLAPSSDATPTPVEEPRKLLDVDARSDKFVLSWKRGSEVLETVDVPVTPAGEGSVVRYPGLAAKVEEMWNNGGEHRSPTDPQSDRATVRLHDRMPYREAVAVMDAVSQPRRQQVRAGQTIEAPAFELTMGR